MSLKLLEDGIDDSSESRVLLVVGTRPEVMEDGPGSGEPYVRDARRWRHDRCSLGSTLH